ncbi:transporter (formate/nitrite transporter family protein) [Rhodopseudomonas palustris]|uniref:Transporter (Formate/nitrite transporter family protein) n=1 Tax=Rhodopseudomonas palustris TaxID=1076 RepID=A0A0D7ELB7_RHOPL|nr:transporter (formate/nitrite transporter family protein) [Rhodopseudomonas palustris]
MSEQELDVVDDLSAPRSPVIYEVVRRHGEEEMERPLISLWWSGVAAGLAISFSLLGMAILKTHLPNTLWSPLLTSAGYCVGFLIVVLGRLQLFTESTITVVLPVLKDPSSGNIRRMARLWSIVLAANLVGTLFAALFCNFTPAISETIYAGMLDVSRKLIELGWWETLFRAIASGFLIAAMVWIIPSAESAKFAVITLMTYLIAVGEFTHVIAGSMEAYLLVLAGDWEWWRMIGHFLVPTLLGNIIGGTALFALISYGQVMREI